MKKRNHVPLFLTVSLLLSVFISRSQSVVSVGSGSYASSVPAAENVNTDNSPVYMLPGITDPVPTNDWWTPLILQNMYGSTQYHLWAHPLDFAVDNSGLLFYFPTEWSGGNDMNKQMVLPSPLHIGGAGFTPSSERVRSWGDWTVSFRLQENAAKYADVTIGHGLPLAWIEYTGISSGQVAIDASASYYAESGALSFPFTGDHFGFLWQGRNYALFSPAGTVFSLSNGVITAAFSGTDHYLIVAALSGASDLSTFYQYAYAIPRNSTVGWNYNESAGALTTTWNISTQALRGTNTQVIQGFLPHQYKYTTLGFGLNGINYASARGQVRCAAGNNFQVTYPFNGALSHLPAPEVLPGKQNGYDPSVLNNYINTFATGDVLLGENNTYGSGKSLTKFADFIANASVLGNTSQVTLQSKLKTALTNWLTYTPGEPNTYYSYLPNFKALMGFDVGYGSEQFNDHHFHYGYHVYAAGILGLHDQDFIGKYGEMAKLVAKEYANWDRNDKRFPFLRTFDPWEGHSWANGGYGMNPPIGNNQESSSEAMMSWTGLIQLGLATGDADMTSAGVFGYVSEAAAANEYWFNRDNENFPSSYGAPGKIACIVGGCNIEYQTFFGLNPIYVHAIQYIPVMPSSYYLVQHDKFSAAQTEFDFLRSRSVSQGYGDIGSWGTEWDNLALRYASLFNPEWAAANQAVLGTDAGEAGLSYYAIHSNRALGKWQSGYHIGATNSGVFYNTDLNRFTYCAFNPTAAAKTYTVYQGAGPIGTITVPARSFFSTHTLNGSGNQPPVVNITSPTGSTGYTAPATITINASASDADGTVKKVVFFNGDVMLATDSSAPYSYTWTNVPAGGYVITARATDDSGLTGVSAAVNLTVTATTSPNLALNKPTTVSSVENASYPGSAAVDGNAGSTRWSSAFSDPQWIYVDLGAVYSINEVRVRWEDAYGSNYLVQLSSDAVNWTTLRAVSGNTTLVNDFTGLTGNGRYVRIYGSVRGTVYGYSIYELEVYGVPASGTCTGAAVNGDYTYQVSSSGNTVNWVFVPQSPIAGSTLSIIYINTGSGYAGYTMTGQGSNFIFSQAESAGAALSFYFTYRVGATTTERNSMANPHSYTVGTSCSGSLAGAGAGIHAVSGAATQQAKQTRPGSADGGLLIFPNPVSGMLTIHGYEGGRARIVDLTGREVMKLMQVNASINVSALPPGIYTLMLINNERVITRSFVKK